MSIESWTVCRLKQSVSIHVRPIWRAQAMATTRTKVAEKKLVVFRVIRR